MIVLIISFLLKRLKIDFYNNIKEKEKFAKIGKTVDIYIQLLNEESKLIYNNKKKLIESFLKKRNNNHIPIDIPKIINNIDECDCNINYFKETKEKNNIILLQNNILQSYEEKNNIAYQKPICVYDKNKESFFDNKKNNYIYINLLQVG